MTNQRNGSELSFLSRIGSMIQRNKKCILDDAMRVYAPEYNRSWKLSAKKNARGLFDCRVSSVGRKEVGEKANI
jgi:hypothetical protein